MSRLLVISPDVIGTRMAGVGIRYWSLADALARQGIEVTLATLGKDLPDGEGFEVVGYAETSYKSLAPHVNRADVLLVSGYLLSKFPALKTRVPMIVDLFDPFMLENLEVFSGGSLDTQTGIHRKTMAVVNEQLRAGDLFVCASEKQRDFWLGMLAANNRVNPYVYAQDPTLSSLLAVVPFGLPTEPPRHTRPVLKGVHPGIGTDDRVILWGGGIWDWYDPLTLIRAVHKVCAVRGDVKLVFMGVKHPNPDVPTSRQLAAAIELSQDLGLHDRHVFVSRGWVPYEQIQDYFLEADIGTVLHHNHLETRFSFRVRILTCLWTGLPILITEGSSSSDLVRDEQLGRVVGYQDVEGTAGAILDMLSLPDMRAHYRPHFERVRQRFTWERVVQPLVGFCRAPRFAADKDQMIEPQATTPGWRLPNKAWQTWRQRGTAGLVEEIRSYARWWWGRRSA